LPKPIIQLYGMVAIFEFDTSHQHTKESNFPPQLKMYPRICTSCAKKFMPFSRNAQFFW